MVKYQITLEVPDDFKPEEMGIDLSYKDEITITSEGFVESDKLPDELIDRINIKKETVAPNDVVIFKFPQELANSDPQALNSFRDQIEATLKCPTLGIIDDLDLLVQNADQAIDMLNGMIAKVKVRSAVGNASKIILT